MWQITSSNSVTYTGCIKLSAYCPSPKVPMLRDPIPDWKNFKETEKMEGSWECTERFMKVNEVKKDSLCGWARWLASPLNCHYGNSSETCHQNGQSSIDASEWVAESHGFATKWSGWQVCKWTHHYIQMQDLPKSLVGNHAKVYSLLSDPDIAAKLRTYVHLNKWAMNPEKLAKFSQDQLVPSTAHEYLEHITQNEMPIGLKRYMDIELFPWIHLWVGQAISLMTAQWWLHKKGFKYINHKKGLYFNGHDRPDVIKYCQDHFLPAMKACEAWLVR